ncbi:MAG: elongation factor-1 alpha [Methylococcaceae bacterium]|nr:elongation factor-1 alpha [Methylococcaceae bacterium]
MKHDSSHGFWVLAFLAHAPSALAEGEGRYSGYDFDHAGVVLIALALFAFAFWPRHAKPAGSSTPPRSGTVKHSEPEQTMEKIQTNTLAELSMAYKVLFTGFLLVTGVGLLMAGAQIMLTHGMADGKPGLSINDIVYSYYGNRSGSKLESMLNGAMKPMAPDEVRFEMIQWARDGAPAERWADEIAPLMQKHCIACHNGESALPNFSKLEVVKPIAEVDHGVTIKTLTRVSHIHLFGIAFIFLFVGWIFGMAQFDRRWKIILIATPFAFLLLDILSWWLTKYWPAFAWLTMIGGIGYSLASTVMIFTSLYQMWLPHWEQRHPG